MASQYPPFIFSDSVPASQMIEHARAVNEGMRIAELGKARQAEGMFRIAQLQQQQKSQQEKNELDRMIAQSQIAQAKIGNEFRDRQLTQEGKMADDRNKNYLEGLRIQFPEGKVSPQEKIFKEKLELEEADRKRAADEELRMVTEAERALDLLDKKETELKKIQSSGSKNVNLPVVQRNAGEITRQRASILDTMGKSGYSYDPITKRFIGVNRSSPPPSASAITSPQPQAPSPLSASGLGGTIDLTPFQKATMGLQSGQTVVQDGVTYLVR